MLNLTATEILIIDAWRKRQVRSTHGSMISYDLGQIKNDIGGVVSVWVLTDVDKFSCKVGVDEWFIVSKGSDPQFSITIDGLPVTAISKIAESVDTYLPVPSSDDTHWIYFKDSDITNTKILKRIYELGFRHVLLSIRTNGLISYDLRLAYIYHYPEDSDYILELVDHSSDEMIGDDYDFNIIAWRVLFDIPVNEEREAVKYD